MSASREKKTRQDLNSSGWADPKNAREAKQRKEEHRTNLLYGTIGVVFLVLAIVAVVWRTNIIPKTLTAATVNGEKYTAAEVNFYFENYYQNFLNRNYSVLSMIGLDTGSSLKDQTVSDTANSLLPAMGMPEAEEGQSWYDYMADRALEQLAGVQAMNDAAEADGFTWNDDLQSQLDETMDSLSTTASSYGYTEQQYLGLIYGSTMTAASTRSRPGAACWPPPICRTTRTACPTPPMSWRPPTRRTAPPTIWWTAPTSASTAPPLTPTRTATPSR